MRTAIPICGNLPKSAKASYFATLTVTLKRFLPLALLLLMTFLPLAVDILSRKPWVLNLLLLLGWNVLFMVLSFLYCFYLLKTKHILRHNPLADVKTYFLLAGR